MSNALSLYSPQEQVALAADVWPLANRLASTEFVPKALQGRPESVMACMIKGAELGIPLMQSLSSIHVIEGKPTMSAELMRAVVLSRGHDLEIVESSSTRCVARGKREGKEQWQTFTRTIEDAKAANLLGKQVWRSYPADMLLARVTGALCRAVFADCLAGISYTREELEDGEDSVAIGAIETEPAPAPAGRTARARNAATRGAPKTTAAADPVEEKTTRRGELPKLPGEEDDIVDAEVVEDDSPAEPFAPVVDDDPAIADPGDTGGTMPGPSRIAMLLGKHGVTDRAERLAAASQFVGRPLDSSKAMTPDEQGSFIVFLNGLPDGVPFPFADAPDVDNVFVGEGVPVPVRLPDAKADDTSPPPSRDDEDPEDWSGDQWRMLLKAHDVRPSVFAGHINETHGMKSMDSICGSGQAAALLAWVLANGKVAS